MNNNKSKSLEEAKLKQNFMNNIYSSFFRHTESDGDNYEDYDFYINFLNQGLLEHTKILSYMIIDNDMLNKHTVYLIQIKTKHLEYTLQKRYSEFHHLIQIIERKYRELALQVTNFPKKKIFGSLDLDLIELRKNSLNQFLMKMTEKYDKYNCLDFLEFLQIKKHYQQSNIQIDCSLVDESILNKARSNDEKYILKFLEQINMNFKNLGTQFKDIEDYFRKQNPSLSPHIISLFLFGERQLKGILSFINKYDEQQDQNHIICSNGLRFLLFLLDYEDNKEAELFQAIFCSANLKHIHTLQLGFHITQKNQKPCTLYALQILDKYLARNPGHSQRELDLIFGSEEAQNEYLKWKSKNKFQSKKTENFQRPSIADIENQFQLIDKILKRKTQVTKQEDLQINEKLERISLDMGFDHLKLNLFLGDKTRQWVQVKSQDQDITIKHFKGIYIKMNLYLKIKPMLAFILVAETQTLWNSLLKEYRVLKVLDNNTSIIYEKLIWNTPSQIKYLIYISEKKTQKIEEEEYLITKRSLGLEEEIKLKKDEFFAEQLFCIQIKRYNKIQKRNDSWKQDRVKDASKIRIICKNFDKNSKLFVSSDLLGESYTLFNELKKLKQYCEVTKLPEDPVCDI